MGILDSSPDQRISSDIPEEQVQEVSSALRESFTNFFSHQDWDRLDDEVITIVRQYGQHSFERGKRAAFDSLKN